VPPFEVSVKPGPAQTPLFPLWAVDRIPGLVGRSYLDEGFLWGAWASNRRCSYLIVRGEDHLYSNADFSGEVGGHHIMRQSSTSRTYGHGAQCW